MDTFNIIILISTIAIGISPFFHTPSSYRKKYKTSNKLVDLFNQKWVKIAYYAFFSILILFCTDLKQTDSELLILKNKAQSDAALAKRIIQAEKESKAEVASILGKYGFMLDTTNQLLTKIKDKPIALLHPVVYPKVDFAIKVDSIKNNVLPNKIYFSSKEASTTIVNVNVDYAVERNGKLSLLKKNALNFSNRVLLKDQVMEWESFINDIKDIDKIFVYISGVHASEDGKRFLIKEYLVYDLVQKDGGYVHDDGIKALQQVFK